MYVKINELTTIIYIIILNNKIIFMNLRKYISNNQSYKVRLPNMIYSITDMWFYRNILMNSIRNLISKLFL